MNGGAIPYPPRLELARLPTPLEPLARLGAKLGVDLWVKRDDMTGVELTGNKVRKLEFLLAEARAQGADTVITCGGAQSNHCRATAVAARRLGMNTRLLLRTPDPASPPPVEANILLDLLVGAEIVWVTPDEYARREELFVREAAGRNAYVVPEGGSNCVGAWGYVRAADELRRDLAALPDPDRPVTIVHATGSGGTTAGLILGTALTGLRARVVGVNVCDDRAYFERVIGGILDEFLARWPALGLKRSALPIEILDGYKGRGYAISSPDELATIRDLARSEAIVLDPVYGGKAFHGMLAELGRDRRAFGERVVFVHTGGIFGLFAKAAELAAVL